MKSERTPVLLLLVTAMIFFYWIDMDIFHSRETTNINNDKIIVLDLVPNDKRLNNEYILNCIGKAVDNTGNIINDVIVVSVSSIFPTKKVAGLAQIRIQAISDTAKEEIDKTIVSLPELVYESVQIVAQSEIDLKKAKTKKAFDTSIKKYLTSINQSNDMVSLHGYQILAKSYILQGGEVVLK